MLGGKIKKGLQTADGFRRIVAVFCNQSGIIQCRSGKFGLGEIFGKLLIFLCGPDGIPGFFMQRCQMIMCRGTEIRGFGLAQICGSSQSFGVILTPHQGLQTEQAGFFLQGPCFFCRHPERFLCQFMRPHAVIICPQLEICLLIGCRICGVADSTLAVFQFFFGQIPGTALFSRLHCRRKKPFCRRRLICQNGIIPLQCPGHISRFYQIAGRLKLQFLPVRGIRVPGEIQFQCFGHFLPRLHPVQTGKKFQYGQFPVFITHCRLQSGTAHFYSILPPVGFFRLFSCRAAGGNIPESPFAGTAAGSEAGGKILPIPPFSG